MLYRVQGGESLWKISAKELGDGRRWPEIARLNHLSSPDRLVIGQALFLPEPQRRAPVSTAHAFGAPHPSQPSQASQPLGAFEKQSPLLPAWGHFFVFADELDPLRRKLIRRVMEPPKTLSPEEFQRVLHPELHGFTAKNPASNVSLGRHILGDTKSKFISASENRPGGADRFEGTRYWIDAEQAKAAGVKIHEAEDIAKDVERTVAKSPSLRGKADHILKLSRVADREVALEGAIPASAVKTATSMGITRGFQLIEGVGIVISAYDLEKAAKASAQQHSVVPITKEGIRQGAGWGGAAVGRIAVRGGISMAARWAAAEEGAELGGMGGAALGIETGPGALITGGIGALVFGTAAFLGADWATKKIFGGK